MIAKTQGQTKWEEVDSHCQIETKRKFAQRLLERERTDKNEAMAVALLEDCVVLGDAVAMLMLAKCCTLGCGIEVNIECAEKLFQQSGEKGNQEAISFGFLRSYWQEQKHIDWYCLCLVFKMCQMWYSNN